MKADKYIGQKFGKLTITGVAPTPEHIKNKNSVYVYCYCECNPNNKLIKSLTNILYGGTRSCGCLNKERDIYEKKCNKLKLYDTYGCGTDSKGRKFYFSLEDYDRIKKFTWTVHPTRGEVINHKTGMKMHRFIMSVTDSDVIVDHINHNRADNRRENLRITDKLGNARNTYRPKTKSPYPGVFKSRNNKWYVRIRIRGRNKELGTYDDLLQAIKVKKEAEQKYFGDYSYEASMQIANNYKIEKE